MNRFNIRLLTLCLLGIFVIAGCKTAPKSQASSDTAKQVAKQPEILNQIIAASGMDDISHVIEIRFTFNVERKNGNVARQWTWRPREDKVTLSHPGPTGEMVSLSYIRGEIAGKADTPANIRMADRWFINDSFWLMMPLHLSWQDPAKLGVQDHGMTEMPLGNGQGKHVTITFPNTDSGGGGYTPGDVYDLYLDDQYLVQQWSFRKGGRETPNLTNTFEAYAQIGDMKLAMNHTNPNGFHLWFNDVTVVTDNK
jgi:hypothetical protein